MNRKLLAACVLSASLVLPTFAQAACTMANLQGTWQAYMQRYNSMTGPNAQTTLPFNSWAQCKMVISATGVITAAASCMVMPVATYTLTAGGKWTLKSGPNCTFTASFKVNNVPHTVQHGTLAKDFNSLSGAGQTSMQSLLINMVRVP